MRHKVLIENGDDWVKVYIDGEQISEGHDFSPFSYAFKEFAKKIGFDLEVRFGRFDEASEEFIPNE